tara:strand:+ start:914 stop:1156 length:243 start_codon:yes stop_codon:yes gene_type:complete
MTRKHYEMIASVLYHRARAIVNSSANNQEKHYALFELRNTMYNFIDEFEQANPRFDSLRFAETCKVERHLNNIKVEIISS